MTEGSRLRVLHLDDGPSFRGGQRQVLWLVSAQQARVDSVVFARSPALMEECRQRGLRASLWAGAGHPMGWWELGKAIRNFRPDIAHCHDARSHGVAAAAMAALGTSGPPALVVTRRIDDAPGTLAWDRWKYRHGTLVAVSEAVASVLRGAGVEDARLRVVRSAIEAPDPLPFPPLGPDDGLIVGVLGALVPHKGHIDLIHAVARVPSGIRLVFVGDGPERRRLEAAARDCGLDDRAVFAGDIQDPRAVYRGVHLHVQPSRTEGLGTAVLWAQAIGRPALVTRVGGLPEALVDGVSGWVVDSGPETLALGLEQAETTLRAESGAGPRMGETGRRFVLDGFATDRMGREIEAVYRELGAGRSVRTNDGG